MEPIFLRMDQVVEIHRDLVVRYGGALGVKDVERLKSALQMPRILTPEVSYIHPDIFEMAGAYLLYILLYDPFLEGNRRTGSAAALVFLRINGVHVEVEEQVLEAFVRSVGQGKVDKIRIAEFFRLHSR